MIADVYYEQTELAYKLREMLFHKRIEDNPVGVLDYVEFFCEHMDINPGALITRSRKQEYVLLRSQFVAFVRKQSSETITYQKIGEAIGGRDHATVMNSEQGHEEWMLISASYRQDYISLNKMWRLRNVR